MLVHIAVVEHENGTNIYAQASREKLLVDLRDYIEEFWETTCPDDKIENFNNEDAIEHYFETTASHGMESLKEEQIEVCNESS